MVYHLEGKLRKVKEQEVGGAKSSVDEMAATSGRHRKHTDKM